MTVLEARRIAFKALQKGVALQDLGYKLDNRRENKHLKDWAYNQLSRICLGPHRYKYVKLFGALPKPTDFHNDLARLLRKEQLYLLNENQKLSQTLKSIQSSGSMKINPYESITSSAEEEQPLSDDIPQRNQEEETMNTDRGCFILRQVLGKKVANHLTFGLTRLNLHCASGGWSAKSDLEKSAINLKTIRITEFLNNIKTIVEISKAMSLSKAYWSLRIHSVVLEV